MGLWSSVGYDGLYQENIIVLLVLLSVSDLFPQKIGEQKFENTSFSIGDETQGDIMIREGAF
jgi:hypothetical protein